MSNGEAQSDYIAWLLAREFNLAPHQPLKYERVMPTDNIGSHFFANTSNSVKILVLYDVSELDFS